MKAHLEHGNDPRQNPYVEIRGFLKGSSVTLIALIALQSYAAEDRETYSDFPDATEFIDTLQPCAEGKFVWETNDGRKGIPVDDRCAIDRDSGGVDVYSRPTNQLVVPHIKLPRGTVVIPLCSVEGSAIENVDGENESTWYYVSLANTPPVYENFSKDGSLEGYIPKDSAVGDTSMAIPACTPDTRNV